MEEEPFSIMMLQKHQPVGWQFRWYRLIWLHHHQLRSFKHPT